MKFFSYAVLAAIAYNIPGGAAAAPILPTQKGYAPAQQHFRKIVKANLTDPDSAKFVGTTGICEYSTRLKMAILKVNSRNRFGGYAGPQSALVMDMQGDARVVFPSTMAEGTLAEIDAKMNTLKLAQECAGKVRDAALRAAGKLGK